MPPRGFSALEPTGPFTAQELHLPLVDGWTPLRLLLYPITAAMAWLGLLPIAIVIHLIHRSLSLLSSLFHSSPLPPPSPPLPHPPSPSSSLPLPPTLPLHPTDSIWLHSSPYHHNVITAVLHLSSPLPFPLLLHRISTHILPSPGMERLRYLPDPCTSLWHLNPHFILTDHVTTWPHWKLGSSLPSSLPPPSSTATWGEGECSAALLRLVSSLINTPVLTAAGVPTIWSFALLPEYADGCVVVFRAHHILADGVLLSGVLLEMLMDTQQPHADEPQPTATTPAVPSSSGARLQQRLSLLGQLALTALLGPLQAMRLSLAADDRNPLHCPDGTLVSAHKSVGWSSQPISLHRVKRISRYYHASVNDVMMAVFTATLQRMVKQRGMTDGERSRWQQRAMHFVVPINIRPLFTSPSTPLTLGNLFSVLILPFPLYQPSPRARLLALTRQMNGVKRSVLPLMMFVSLYLTVTLLPSFIAHSFIGLYQEQCTAIITNNRSPATRLSLCGRELRSWVSWAPCGGALGMSMTMMSYAGEMRVSVVVDAACGVAGAEVVAAFDEEFERLEEGVTTDFMPEVIVDALT